MNYIYGTFLAIRGLRAANSMAATTAILHGAEFLRGVQNDDGGWGETCASYDDPTLKGKGPSTASQTAWAVMGLVAAADRSDSNGLHSKAILRGIEYLVSTQNADGSWTEGETTGTGFPRVFYLRYHYYRVYFPMMALARYRLAIRLRDRRMGPSLAGRVSARPLSL